MKKRLRRMESNHRHLEATSAPLRDEKSLYDVDTEHNRLQ